jgi:hypothetical protein
MHCFRNDAAKHLLFRWDRHRIYLFLASLFLPLLVPGSLHALGGPQYIETSARSVNFVIAARNRCVPLYVDKNDYPGVQRAAADLQSDLQRVTGITPGLRTDLNDLPEHILVVGTLGKSELLDRLIREAKIDVSAITGRWESYLIQTVNNPLPGVASALIVAGSDKRGAIFGIYDLSEQIGVSPWYWWADVPVAHHSTLTVKPGAYLQGPPAVKYRGIFLNDEAPSLTGWVKEKFGNYNHDFYSKVFELILRLKGNYLWPAMWNNAFNEDDALNAKLADEYGIVMGTSHHEPMMRAQQEWKRHGSGPWNHSQNASALREFWKQGMERNKDYEEIVTIGMRGDGDLPMSESADISLLERIVADQRSIIGETFGRDPATIPQDWALYKEVQGYYEKGMRVPDDVTLLWCDDNWGNIRRLPTPDERKRKGGAGIYYHFDYVGDPRSYKWINTNPIPKVWEQLNLALNYGADRIWIVNVGDLKPMEFPTEFFLSLAWNPARWSKEHLQEFTQLWAQREFGPLYAKDIADVMEKYTKFNSRRKPELLSPDTFSVVNYREAETVAAEFQAIVSKAESISQKLPANEKDAFYELVLYPAKSSAVVTQMYIAAGKNHLCAAQGRATTNDLADQVQILFNSDAQLSSYYNHQLAGGKWNHMMDQTHIGYTSWNEPPVNTMPAVSRIDLPADASMGIAVEGSAEAWPGSPDNPVLPQFDVFNKQRFFIDVFNRGRAPFTFTATPTAPWIVLNNTGSQIEKEGRVWVSVDWRNVPAGTVAGSIEFQTGTHQNVSVRVEAFRPSMPTEQNLDGFVEAGGVVSMESSSYMKKIDTSSCQWKEIADLGRTRSAMTVFPVTAASVSPPLDSPRLEYRMFLFHSGALEVQSILDPSLNFVPGRGLRYAISFDDDPPQTVDALADQSSDAWAIAVQDSVRKSKTNLNVKAPGYHTLKFWMVDPGVVLQKIIVNTGGLKDSYLGPTESHHRLLAQDSKP